MGRSFGKFLRGLRKKKGLSQRDLASRVGIDFSYVSKVENDVPGFESPSEMTLTRLSEALDVDADEMITRAGKIPSDVRRILVDDFSLVKEIRDRRGDYSSGGGES